MISFKPFLGLTIATAISFVLLLGLGKWQLDRLHWKLELIAAAETRAHAEPVPVESLAAKKPADIEYAHAVADGEYVPGKTTYLFSQLEDSRIGLEVLDPLRLKDGRVVIVDRGFVPAKDNHPAIYAPPPSGAVRVTGLVRRSEKPGPFTPTYDPSTRVFYGRDTAAIAGTAGVQAPLPFVLAADAGPAGFPEGGHTRLTFRNDHLQYALTWFALAGVLLVIYLAYHGKAGRLRIGRQR
jgi:surfeit locus 1 family protein